MKTWEREVIRELAKEKLELANSPLMQKRALEWSAHNSLKGDRPMMHFEMHTVDDDGFKYKCKCQSEDAIAIEYSLGESMANHKMVGDDRVVTADFVCGYRSRIIQFDMPVKKEETEGVGFHIISQIEDLDTVDLIKPSTISYDIDGSLKWKSFVEEQIGDILNVRMGMGALGACLTNDIVHRMGMENMFTSIYDNPENFHFMMNSLSDDYVRYFKGLEQNNMITSNNGNDWLAQGSFGFCKDLPNDASLASQCWGYMDSQETVGISSDMFNEFFFPYYKKVADCFGLLSYGCCEPVHAFWEKSLSKFTNLRKISISPWCDEEYMGNVLSGSNIIYLRKPSPNFVGTGTSFDETGFRAHIRKTLKAAKGCTLEIAFRDVYTLEGDLNRPRRAVEILREEIVNIW